MRNGLSPEELEHEIVFMITAGSDQTATAIRQILLNVISSPTVYLILKSEIFKAVRAGNVSNPITLEEAKRIPYLHASSASRLKEQESVRA